MPLLPKPLIFSSFETLKISIFLRENHYFSGFCKNVFSPFEQFVSAKNRRKNHEKSRPNHEKIESEIHLFFNIDFFAFWAPFWKVLGASWASLGRPWASKMWPKRVPIIEGEQFCFNFCCFRGATFGSLRFGRVWGGFGKGFWRFGEGFLSGFREFCDHFYIDFYNFYRFRGATLLSLIFLAILDGWEK